MFVSPTEAFGRHLEAVEDPVLAEADFVPAEKEDLVLAEEQGTWESLGGTRKAPGRHQEVIQEASRGIQEASRRLLEASRRHLVAPGGSRGPPRS